MLFPREPHFIHRELTKYFLKMCQIIEYNEYEYHLSQSLNVKICLLGIHLG